MTENNRLNASISLDLDNLWSYLKVHSDPGWSEFPSYLDIFIPLILKLLDEIKIKITFCVVGKDATIEKNYEFIKLLSENGHELGNHSFNHNSWLQSLSKNEIENEVLKTEEAIYKLTNKKTVGFRGPGFTWNRNLLEILQANGYLYDASTFPTYIGPIARNYYFLKSNFSKKEKNEREKIFGNFSDGFKSLKPYLWNIKPANTNILEIPVTTIPIIKIPFHLSYLLYLSNYSTGVMDAYLNFAILMCKITKTEPSFLLHPLDLLGFDLVKNLGFFPGMNIRSEIKSQIFHRTFTKLSKNFNLITMGEHAKILLSKNLKVNTI